MNVTVVTAFFDIKRGEEGDGRSTSEYEQWIKKTMTLNSNFYVVTDEKHKHLFTGDRVYVKTMNFEDSGFVHNFFKEDPFKEDPNFLKLAEEDFIANKVIC